MSIKKTKNGTYQYDFTFQKMFKQNWLGKLLKENIKPDEKPKK